MKLQTFLIDRRKLDKGENRLLYILYLSQVKKELEARLRTAYENLKLSRQGLLIGTTAGECKEDIKRLERLIEYSDIRGGIAVNRIITNKS